MAMLLNLDVDCRSDQRTNNGWKWTRWKWGCSWEKESRWHRKWREWCEWSQKREGRTLKAMVIHAATSTMWKACYSQQYVQHLLLSSKGEPSCLPAPPTGSWLAGRVVSSASPPIPNGVPQGEEPNPDINLHPEHPTTDWLTDIFIEVLVFTLASLHLGSTWSFVIILSLPFP